MEGNVEKKESSKWIPYWAVLKGVQLVFFKDKNIASFLDIGCQSRISSKSAKGNNYEFELKLTDGKKYLLRVTSEALRVQWIHALKQTAEGKFPTEFELAEDQLPDLENNTEQSETDNGDRKKSNPYSEVPPFLSMGSHIAPGMNDQDMQKDIAMKKPHTASFGTHCKRMLFNRTGKSLSADAAGELEEQKKLDPGIAEAPEPPYDDIPEEKPPWFVGNITRDRAEILLQDCPSGTFLVRNSESVLKAGAFTLSIRRQPSYRHHKIETLFDGQLVMKGHETKPFPNMAILMKYFAKSVEHEVKLIPYQNEEAPVMTPDLTLPTQVVKHSYENLPDKKKVPPPLRKRQSAPVLSGYVNVPSRDRPPLPNRTSNSVHPGYENLSSKDPPPLPPSQVYSADGPRDYENLPNKTQTLPSNAPDLPPRRPSKSEMGYENLHPAGGTLPPTKPPYQNLPPRAPQRPFSRSSTLPVHLMEDKLQRSGFRT